MLLDLTEEDLKVIRQGLMELPIKVALNTLAKLDDDIIKFAKQSNPNIAMAQAEE